MIGGWDDAGLRICRVGNGRLRQKRFFPANTVVQSQFAVDLPEVLGIQIQVRRVEVLDRVAEFLSEGGVIAARGAEKIFGEGGQRRKGVAAGIVIQLFQIVLRAIGIDADF